MADNLFNDKITVKWGIKWKLVMLITVLLVSMVTILTYLQISSQKEMMEKELSKRTALMKENLIERGKSFTSNLSQHIENDIASFNFSGAIESVKEGIIDNKDIKYAVLTDSSGATLINTGMKHPGQAQGADPAVLSEESLKSIKIFEYTDDNESVIEISHPIQISTNPWGILKIIYTLKHLNYETEISEKQIRKEIRRMMFHSIIAALIFIADCFIIVFILATSFANPLIQLTNFARKLSKGEFSVSSDIHRIRSRDEIGVLASAFIEMSNELKVSYKKLEEYNRTLEQKVEERTKDLNNTLHEVEAANNKIMESIEYARMIQSSLLPDRNKVKEYIPDSFTIWMPRDIVGGDMVFSDFFETDSDLSIVGALIDCTGHGVPGAFMTMLASSSLKQIIRDEGCHDPAEILKRLNVMTKTLLKQDTDHGESDDGMDAGICFLKVRENKLIFAGARLSLYWVENGEVNVIKGDKENIGYRRSDLNFNFMNHTVKIKKDVSFYMTTDGYTDQMGGEPRRRLGGRRFRELLAEIYEKPFDVQKKILMQAFNEHKGKNDIQDDVTVIGFRL